MDTPTDNTLALNTTCRKLNDLYQQIARSEWLGKGDPFVVGIDRLGDPCIMIETERDREWEVATVIEKLLRGELPRHNFRKTYDVPLSNG